MGGTTMVMALVLPEQHCSLLDAYEKCRALADAKTCCDYTLHVGVTWWGPKVSPKLQGCTVKEQHGNTLYLYLSNTSCRIWGKAVGCFLFMGKMRIDLDYT